MKKTIYMITAVFLLALVGCKQKESPQTTDTDTGNSVLTVSQAQLDSLPNSITIEEGENQELTIVDAEISITSSDSTIVNVLNNTITALLPGTCNLLVTFDNLLGSKTIPVTVSEQSKLKISTPPADLYVKQSFTLHINGDYTIDQVVWTSSDTDIATVSESGKVKTIIPGEVYINVSSNDGLYTNSVLITVQNYTLKLDSDSGYVGQSVNLNAVTYPNTNMDIIYTSKDTKKAVVVDNETLLFLQPGRVTVEVSLANYPTIRSTVSLDVKADPIKMIEAFNISTPYAKNITTYGATERDQIVLGSVTKYFFADLNIQEHIVPLSSSEYVGQTATPELLEAVEPEKLVRSGIECESIQYIIYHDTANNTPGAGVYAHANYMVSAANQNARARSWNYTVGAEEIYHHIPDGEVTWQGDSYDAYAKSIGIETCVDYGADLETIWHRMGKLLGKLLVDNNLSLSAIKQHYDMNGKNCPHTLRDNDMYSYAISLAQAEYIANLNFSDYTFTCKSNNPEYVDDRGRVISLPNTQQDVSYTVTVTNTDGYNESITLTSTLAANSK